MSAPVTIHDNVSFESMRRTFFWYDHFWGDQIQDLWRVQTAGTGNAAVVDGIAGGVVRLSTPALNDNVYLEWSNVRSLLASHQVAMETRLRQQSGDMSEVFSNALNNSIANNAIQIYKNTGNDVMNILTENDNVATAYNGGQSWGVDWWILRIQTHLYGGNHIHYYANNAELNNSPISTNVCNKYLQPYFRVTDSGGGGGAVFDVDYVGVRM